MKRCKEKCIFQSHAPTLKKVLGTLLSNSSVFQHVLKVPSLMEVNIVELTILFFAAFLAYVVSILSGGGGALLLIPITTFIAGPMYTAPAINLGNFIGRPVRVFLFWRYIQWNLVWYYAPAAALGAWVGVRFFSLVNPLYLQLIIGVFLVSTLIQFKLGKRRKSFHVSPWHFTPLGFVVSGISSLTGGTGPVQNPFYLNLGVEKEEMIGTKTANAFFMGLVQIGTYTYFEVLDAQVLLYGLVLGAGGSIGNIAGKKLLGKISLLNFRRLVIALMVISGLILTIRSVIMLAE